HRFDEIREVSRTLPVVRPARSTRYGEWDERPHGAGFSFLAALRASRPCGYGVASPRAAREGLGRTVWRRSRDGRPEVREMNCPGCGGNGSKVLESRIADAGDAMRRRRECLDCSERFTTYE